MSLFKFGDLEAEIDFTDVDFLEILDDAKKTLAEEAPNVPKVGKTADIIRAQCQCYFNFFDTIIGDGAHESMFQGKTSLSLCLEAAEALIEHENFQAESVSEKYGKYQVQQTGNRQQRRYYNKQQGRNHNKNYNKDSRR